MMISYAQNYEDVMLLRALGDVERGFYVDVGAQDPVDDSVTKAFYRLGWRGINIEAVPRWHAKLVDDRPHDVNLNVIASAGAGSATFYEVADSGLSTLDADLAKQHAGSGHAVTTHRIECRTLDSILEQHAAPEIHFLKIDVEGSEADVLAGLSLRRFRPWILLIESRAPNSTIETHDAWEPGVLAAGYGFVYDDGLNRFYIAQEQAARARHFASPPNFWDRFIRAQEWRAVEEAARMRSEWSLIETGQRIGELSHGLSRALADAESLQRQISALTADRDGLAQELQRAGRELGASRQREFALDATVVEQRNALHSLQEAHAAMHESHAALQGSRDALQARYDRLLASRSWRLTRPMRVLSRLLANGPAELRRHLAGTQRQDSEIDAVIPAAAPAAAELRQLPPQEALARAALDVAWRKKDDKAH